MAADFSNIKALAFDHYGTLFDKHAVSSVIEKNSGHGEEMAEVWFTTIKKHCRLSGFMERYLTGTTQPNGRRPSANDRRLVFAQSL